MKNLVRRIINRPITVICIVAMVVFFISVYAPEWFFPEEVIEYKDVRIQRDFPMDYAEPLAELHPEDILEYKDALIRKGFPMDYAESLAELHLLHPKWSFNPLLVTEINSSYTWEYVIEQEMKPGENLVYNYDIYAAYKHPTDTELYDSGYYQASVETVEYFMDPRNFLNEADIFYFFDLAAGSKASKGAVEAVLVDTFMENTVLENGKTYAENICDAGGMLQINPVFLAAKIRQEQGQNGASPLLSGTAGTLLNSYYQSQTQVNALGRQILPPTSGYTTEELLALNGYYNLFNVSASGTGLFQIYFNGLTRASQGTPELSRLFGGTPAWDALWKSLYGGAYVLKKSYVDRYQPTPYLQKFNVDGRISERNFWGQYMQLIWGGMNEAHTLYESFASIDALDSPLIFQIPVYAGMPEVPCPDPASGTCLSLAPATARYSYSADVSSPERLHIENAPVYATYDAECGSLFSCVGSADHIYGVTDIEYSVDGGDWISCGDGNNFKIVVPIEENPKITHVLTVRGKAAFDNKNETKNSNSNFLLSVLNITAVADRE